MTDYILLFPVNYETTVFLGGLSVTVLSITKDIFVYLVITIRCKRRVKNCKFQFDSYQFDSYRNHLTVRTVKLKLAVFHMPLATNCDHEVHTCPS